MPTESARSELKMSWLFGGRTHSQQPDTTSLEQARDRQILSLHNHLTSPTVNVVELRRHVDYRVEFTAGPQRLRLLIHLPPEFPRARPSVRFDTPVTHPWVDQQMNVTGCSSLNEFKMHSILGKVINEIITEFQRSPPPPQPSHAPYPAYPPPHQHPHPFPPSQPYPRYPTQPRFPTPPPFTHPGGPPPTHPGGPPLSSHPGGFRLPPPLPRPGRPAPAPPGPDQRQSSLPVYNAPAIPQDFPELNDLSLDELEELCSKPEKILEFIENLAAVKKLHDDRDELNGEIEEQARINLEKEPEMQEKVQKLTDQHEILATVKKTFEEHQQQHQDASHKFSNEMVLTNFTVLVQTVEEESESVAERFLQGELDVDDFIKQYTDRRKLYHCRKAKEEKLQKIVQRQF